MAIGLAAIRLGDRVRVRQHRHQPAAVVPRDGCDHEQGNWWVGRGDEAPLCLSLAHTLTHAHL
eukprot:5030974-Pleurochrysis_carterae.AAC.2